jgi:hypothetical protein
MGNTFFLALGIGSTVAGQIVFVAVLFFYITLLSLSHMLAP